jgi:hypothetical protein
MGEEMAEVKAEADEFLDDEMDHYSAPEPEDFGRRGRGGMTLSQRIEEFVKPAHTTVPDALAGLQVGDSVEVFVDAAPDEKNSDESPQAGVPFAGGRAGGRGRWRGRGRGRGRGPRRGRGPTRRAGGAVSQPRWVCGTVSERTLCDATGSDLIWIDLPSDIKPKKQEEYENSGFMAHRHIRRQDSQLKPATVQLPACAEDANSRVGFVVASLDKSVFHERSRACRQIAVHHPELLVGQTILVEKSEDEDMYFGSQEPCATPEFM